MAQRFAIAFIACGFKLPAHISLGKQELLPFPAVLLLLTGEFRAAGGSGWLFGTLDLRFNGLGFPTSRHKTIIGAGPLSIAPWTARSDSGSKVHFAGFLAALVLQDFSLGCFFRKLAIQLRSQ